MRRAQTALVIPFPSDRFAEAWELCTPIMKRRSEGQERVRAIWGKHAIKITPDRLLTALRRYVAEDEDVRRNGGPGLQVWLNRARYEHWLDAGASAPTLDIRFEDDVIRASFTERFTDPKAQRWFDRCKMDGHTLVIPWPAKSEWIAGPFAKWAQPHGIQGWRLSL